MFNKILSTVVTTTAIATVAAVGFIAGYAVKRKKDVEFLDTQLARADEALEKAEKWVAEKKAAIAAKRTEKAEQSC